MKKSFVFLGITMAFLVGTLMSPLFYEKVASAFNNPTSPFIMLQDFEKSSNHPIIIVDTRTKVQYMQTKSGDVTLIVDQTGKPLIYTGKLD